MASTRNILNSGRYIVAAIIAATMSSCFTGVESTPKITAKDVTKEHIPLRPEDTFLADIVGEPLGEWRKGKRFVVTDPRFSLLLAGNYGARKQLDRDTITFSHWREVSDIRGDRIAEVFFLSTESDTLLYRSTRTVQAIEKDGFLNIPFLVDCDMVDAVSARIKGKEYYIMTSVWYDDLGNAKTGRKFVPVTVKEVLPGTSVYSIILGMADEKGSPFRIFMSVGHDVKSLRSFGTLFSFDNPKTLYSAITQETWDNIVHGKVREGMTRDECKLALGSPASVDRAAGYSVVREIWGYENGVYLIFEDNILRSFRQ